MIIFDLETTGLLAPSCSPLEKQPKIIEIGAYNVTNEDSISQLINPNEKLVPKITKITGIKDEELLGKPTFKDFLPTLAAFFQGSKTVIAHNAPFDCGVLRVELERCGDLDFPWPKRTVCTVQEYRAKFGYRPKLGQLYKKLTGEKLNQTHRAIEDVMALYEALKQDKFFEVIR